MINKLSGGQEVAPDYRYDHFTTKLLIHDGSFHRGARRPGEMLPAFDLPTTDGDRIVTEDFVGDRPLLLVTGSITCPMTASAVPSLKRLFAQCGEDVAFVMLDVREAHPGENYPQPVIMEQKMNHARALRDLYQLPWTVAVDDLDGTLNLAMDAKPNSAYLMDSDGKIVFRSLWARDLRGSIRRPLESAAHERPPAKDESHALLLPVILASGVIDVVMKRAGPTAVRDHWRSNFPLQLAARVASWFRPLSPDWRAIAAVATLSAATAMGLVVGLRLVL
ncbi:MAG: deiodinase-like protein [Acidimicrobiales bacterium]